MIQDFKRTASESGRNIANFDWCFQLRLSIGETEEEARKNVSGLLKTNLAWRATRGTCGSGKIPGGTPKGAEEAPKSSVETAVVGTPAMIRERIEEFIDA